MFVSDLPILSRAGIVLCERHRQLRKENKEPFKVGHRLIEASRGKGAKSPSK